MLLGIGMFGGKWRVFVIVKLWYLRVRGNEKLVFVFLKRTNIYRKAIMCKKVKQTTKTADLKAYQIR